MKLKTKNSHKLKSSQVIKDRPGYRKFQKSHLLSSRPMQLDPGPVEGLSHVAHGFAMESSERRVIESPVQQIVVGCVPIPIRHRQIYCDLLVSVLREYTTASGAFVGK